MTTGAFTYALAALAYGFFALLLIFSWRASQFGRVFTFVMVLSALWATVAAFNALPDSNSSGLYQSLELMRYVAWYVFLLQIFIHAETRSQGFQYFGRKALWYSAGFAVVLLLDNLFNLTGSALLGLIGRILLALIGLAIIEQLYRNFTPRHRWIAKYLFIGLGGVFAYDFYMYSDALLFGGVDKTLWQARGVLHAAIVPLLAVSAARNKDWSLKVFVSRDIVLHSTAILGGGVYLLFMAAAGYYLREYGGDWGRIGQVVFLSLALGMLAAILLSDQIKAQLKVFLAKHFYANKYDYRQEWLRLTDELGEAVHADDKMAASIEALARMVDAKAGMLWLQDENGDYVNVASWRLPHSQTVLPGDASLPQFLLNTAYVINLRELESHHYEYTGLVLPECITGVHQAWLIVPLFGLESLQGFIVLAEPLLEREINWEDRDLLKAAARQIANHLAVITTSDRLAEARQFEVFSRLSAYMVHDMKNIASELEMVAKNASKHASNPEFVQDAFETVDNAANGIKRLLQQLRNKRMQDEKAVRFNLRELLQQVVASRQSQQPAPELDDNSPECEVIAPRERLANVLSHLIENAQQATAGDGQVTVQLRQESNMNVVEITDNGCGMDEDFIRNRLFKPFDTTKGNAGMGIGMYESRDFIRQLGGDIVVNSRPGEGTSVQLHIPADAATDNVAKNDSHTGKPARKFA